MHAPYSIDAFSVRSYDRFMKTLLVLLLFVSATHPADAQASFTSFDGKVVAINAGNSTFTFVDLRGNRHLIRTTDKTDITSRGQRATLLQVHVFDEVTGVASMSAGSLVAVKVIFRDANPGNAKSGSLPVAKPVPGKPGFVISPYAPPQFVDVRGYPRGSQAKDPYTNKVFIVP